MTLPLWQRGARPEELAMTPLEKSSLRHAMEWRRYDTSPQAANDRLIDKQRRAAADRAVGHLPTCSLTKCDPKCRHV